MTAIPAWIQIFQALLAPAIAIAVGIVGFLQWRTSHQKVVLDLFERRWQVYVDLHNLAAAIESEHRNYDAFRQRGQNSWLMARFLFGSDVTMKVDEFWEAVESLENIERAMHLYKDRADELAERQKNNEFWRDKILVFKSSLPRIFSPYLQMAQKSKFR
ncbi:hypothetical protein ACQZ6F_17415 [Rhizobium sp. A22-96]